MSTCIFLDSTTYPIDETILHSRHPHTSNDAYAKRLLETHCKAYQEQYGDNFHLDDAYVIPALIHKCYIAKKESKPFIVVGS